MGCDRGVIIFGNGVRSRVDWVEQRDGMKSAIVSLESIISLGAMFVIGRTSCW
jgi:hypothetical protein